MAQRAIIACPKGKNPNQSLSDSSAQNSNSVTDPSSKTATAESSDVNEAARKASDATKGYLDTKKINQEIVNQKIESMGLTHYFQSVQQQFLILNPQTSLYQLRPNLSSSQMNEVAYFKNYLENILSKSASSNMSGTLAKEIFNSIKHL